MAVYKCTICNTLFDDIRSREDLKAKVDWLRAASGGKPTGIEFAAGHIEDDLDVAAAARRLTNFLRASTEELKDFARLTGKADVHQLGLDDLGATNSEISNHSVIPHV